MIQPTLKKMKCTVPVIAGHLQPNCILKGDESLTNSFKVSSNTQDNISKAKQTKNVLPLRSDLPILSVAYYFLLVLKKGSVTARH